MDGTVLSTYEPLKESVASCSGTAGILRMLLFTQAGTGSMVSTTLTTSAQYFTGAIKADDGFTSVCSTTGMTRVASTPRWISEPRGAAQRDLSAGDACGH